MDVINLNERRREPDASANLQCPSCGGEWFELRGNHPLMPEHGAVVLSREDRRIVGYGGTPHCIRCDSAV